MARMTGRIATVALFTLLVACGKAEELKPAPGMTPPPKPASAAIPPTTEQMLTPSSQAQPERVDELLKRSEKREDDRFDLPPPG